MAGASTTNPDAPKATTTKATTTKATTTSSTGAPVTINETINQTTPAGSSGSSSGGITPATASNLPAALQGADLKNFHGFDISEIPAPLLGQAEQAITKYLATPGLTESVEQKINQDYGFSSWAMSVPAVKSALVVGAVMGWDENTFLGALENTSWWKAQDQNQRAFQQAMGEDPATAHEALQQASSKILETAGRLGVQLDSQTLQKFAYTVASQSYTQRGVIGGLSGMTQEQIDQMVGNAYKAPASGLPNGGEASTLFDSFQKLAGQYLVPMSDQTLNKWVQNALSTYTEQGGFEQGQQSALEDYLKTQASSLYPTLAPFIQQGYDTQTLVDPYRQTAAKVLNVDPDSIDFTKGMWNKALTAGASTPGGGQAGAPGMMTLDQWTKLLKSDTSYGYQNTLDAQTQASGVAEAVGQLFGKVG